MRKHEELSNVTARFIALFAEQSEANAAESQIQGPKSECQVQRFEVWGFGAMGHGALLLRCGVFVLECWVRDAAASKLGGAERIHVLSLLILVRPRMVLELQSCGSFCEGDDQLVADFVLAWARQIATETSHAHTQAMHAYIPTLTLFASAGTSDR